MWRTRYQANTLLTLIFPAATALHPLRKSQQGKLYITVIEEKAGREVGDMISATRFQEGTIVIDRHSDDGRDGRPKDETTIMNWTGRGCKSRDECGGDSGDDIDYVAETTATTWTTSTERRWP